MVNLQMDSGPLEMKNRFQARSKLGFDSDRVLIFEARSVRGMAQRELFFEDFRRLHYDILIEGAAERKENKAKDYNVQGVQLYKEGKLHEAKWCFEKALTLDPSYENAQKNLNTIKRKLAEHKKRKRDEDKAAKVKGAKKAAPRQPAAVDWEEPAAAGGGPTSQQASDPVWARHFRCPGCNIPVRETWLVCNNCGTDLRRYPPIQY